jgi:ABC-type glycerol-3-phosphate transport system substrate-binding protein
MMKKQNLFQKLLAAMMVLVMTLSLCACGGGETPAGTDNGGANAGTTQNHEGKVTISVGYTADYESVYKLLIEAFTKEHPEVNVVSEVIPGSMKGQITKMISLAAADRLPDICVGSEQFGFILQEGWAYPLDNLIENDPDKDAIMMQALENFSYNGHVYGLPYQIQFNSIVVNTDLLDTLNMDEPEYDWTVSEFVKMAKAATTTETSGINYVYNDANPTWGLDNKLMSAMLPEGYEQYGYSFETHTLDLTAGNAWVESNKLLLELRNTYGLVSDELKATAGGTTDYNKKFGEGADALLSGKVLFGNHSTWDYVIPMTGNFGFDMFPVPTGDGLEERIQTHFDFAYMTNKVTEENRDAAYEFLKFITYGDGCLIRMQANMDQFENNPNAFKIYIPASADADVLAAFEETPLADGIKYMLKTIVERPETIQVADCDKLIPNFWSDIEQFRETATQSVKDGTDPAALVTDFQNKANGAMTATWEYFESCMEKNVKDFYDTHPWEQQ